MIGTTVLFVTYFLHYRCNIPVILMGETGCGKTRLLKYLCDLQAKAYDIKNLLCLKVIILYC